MISPYFTYGIGTLFLFVSLIAGVTLDDLRSALKESEILDFDEEAAGRVRSSHLVT